MKNMKVSLKLIISFLIIVILMAVVGGAGIIGLITSSNQATNMYEKQMLPINDVSQLTTLLQRMRVNMREYTIAVATNNPELIETSKASVDELIVTMEGFFNSYAPTITRPEALELFNEARDLYDNEYLGYMQQSYDYALAGDLQGGLDMLELAKPDTIKIVDNLDRCFAIRLEVASELNDSTTQISNTLLWVIIGILVVAIIVAIVLAFYVSGLISKPLAPLTRFMKQAGTTGNIALSPEDTENIKAYGLRKDEIGQTIAASATFVDRINVISGALGTIADGDLTTDIAPLSNKDTLGLSLQNMVENLNTMFGNINASSSQVSTGASQVADGAQALAAGSTQQAASIQQLSSSVSEINSMAKENTRNATEALDDVQKTRELMDVCVGQMRKMLEAMRTIDEKSQNISKTTKVIDDIAFQTNILALNAAVEAARAGQHGKGFAVVAEEVRNLASKSAEAARETGSLIDSSSQSVADGSRIVSEVNESLEAIAEIAQKNTTQVAGIQAVSVHQSEAMDQINTGIDQIAQVIQQNSATAEESAAASEEMSSQSTMLQELISQFRLKDISSAYRSLPSSDRQKRNNAPDHAALSHADAGGMGFGKY